MEGIGLTIEHYKEGGRDCETWNELRDGLGHEALNLMVALSAPAHPYGGPGSNGRRNEG